MYQVAKEGTEELWEVVTPSPFHRVRAAMSVTSEEIGRKLVGEVLHGVDTGKGWLKLRDGGYSMIAGDGLIFLKPKKQETELWEVVTSSPFHRVRAAMSVTS